MDLAVITHLAASADPTKAGRAIALGVGGGLGAVGAGVGIGSIFAAVIESTTRQPEMAVWELLHQRRIRLSRDGEPVVPEDWQPVILAWETWSGDARPALLIEA